jgi:hypothetical protein
LSLFSCCTCDIRSTLRQPQQNIITSSTYNNVPAAEVYLTFYLQPEKQGRVHFFLRSAPSQPFKLRAASTHWAAYPLWHIMQRLGNVKNIKGDNRQWWEYLEVPDADDDFLVLISNIFTFLNSYTKHGTQGKAMITTLCQKLNPADQQFPCRNICFSSF